MKPVEVEKIIQTTGPLLFRFCLSLTKNPHLAEELYQDTFLIFLSNKEKLEEGGNLKGYLFSIAARKWKDEKRKFARRSTIAPISDEPLENIYTEEDTESLAEKNWIREDVQKVIDELDDPLKIVLLLKYMGDCTLEEIGEYCNIPVGTVKSRLFTARKKCKERLEGLGYGPGT